MAMSVNLPFVSCTEAVSPGVPSSTMTHEAEPALKVMEVTVAPETVNAEGWNGATGLLNDAVTVKVELDRMGA